MVRDHSGLPERIPALPRTNLCKTTKTDNQMPMENPENNFVRFCELKYIRNRTRKLAGEQLAFLDGKRLGDVSIGIEDNACCRKIRRIVEKREAQSLRKNAKRSKLEGNGARYHTRHNVSNQFKNLFGLVPEGFHYCA